MAGKGRPKISNTPTNSKKPCTKCGVNQYTNKEYYMSFSELHGDNRVPVCKSCLIGMFDLKNPYESIKSICSQIDKPYIPRLVETSIEENPTNILGTYMKNVGMGQYRGMTWKNSIMREEDLTLENNFKKTTNGESADNLVDKWGEGYLPEEYQLFEKKWKKLIDNYGEKTSLHTEGLITYIRFRVREEVATSKGLIKDAKDWASLASTAAKDAKLNVSQLSKSDISGGVDLMSQLYEAVESEVGIIPLLPKLLEQPYDDADMVIWSIINYTRRLEDKPAVPYRDIWTFYDEMLQEHFTQSNFNKDQIKEFKENRKNIFRDLSEIYKEPLYDGDE